MSFVQPATGEVFRIAVFKSLAANPAERWVNTYEVKAEADLASSLELHQCAAKIVLFEKALHTTAVNFDRAVISTWSPEYSYDPSSFVSIDLSGAGSRTGSGDPLALEVVLKVRRNVSAGRYGTLFYRGVLGEGDVVAAAGVFRLSAVATWDTNVGGAVTAQLTDYILESGVSGLHFVMAGVSKAGVTHIRTITGYAAAGVGIAKMTRRHYNRSTAG